ncbi:MAG: hypothetical protein ACXVA4_08150 [Ktedonobacterales bacterium]
MSKQNGGDGWDTFDWSSWGEAPSADGRPNSANGTIRSEVTRMGHDQDDERRSSLSDDEEDEFTGEMSEGRQEGRWVSQGGILTWEEPNGRNASEAEAGLRAEADSRWAAEDVDLPPGTPDPIRIRAAHAWLARQRALETEAVGMLLLERRRLEQGDASDEEPQRRQMLDDQNGSALDLAVIEHQAAIETYDRLIEALDDIITHTGPARVLVEFYLWLTERLAIVATMPEAPADFAERILLVPVEDEESAGPDTTQSTPRSTAEWQGCADALLQTRRRVEWVSAPDSDD